MGWQQQEKKSYVGIHVPVGQVKAVRAEIRTNILEGNFSEELKEIMFTLYRDLKEE